MWELNLKGEEEPGEELDYERSKKVMEVRTMMMVTGKKSGL